MIVLLYLIIIFQYQFGSSISFLFGFNQSLTLRVIAVLGVLFSIFEFFINRNNILSFKQRKNKKIIITVFSFVGLNLLFTALINGWDNHFMQSYILSMFSTGLSGLLLGVSMSSKFDIIKYKKWTILFCLIMIIPLIVNAVNNSGVGLVSQKGMDTQTLSYAAMNIITLLLFINLDGEDINQKSILNVLTKILCWVMIGVSVFLIFSGGGRGAFVTVIILFAFYLLKLLKEKNYKAICLSFFGVLLLFGVLSFLNRRIDIVSGITRITNLFTSFADDASANDRINLYNSAFSVSSNRYFIGGGAGSTAYDLGFYSHNLFVDVLVDFGLIGVAIFIAFIIRILLRYVTTKDKDRRTRFCFLLFITAIIPLLFSKSWLYDTQFWFSASALFISLATRSSKKITATNYYQNKKQVII